MSSENYYEILGVERNATESDIRKAYHKLALKWHPDKNPSNKAEAERMFKDVAEAYDVLSNKRKRDAYDRYGKGFENFVYDSTDLSNSRPSSCYGDAPEMPSFHRANRTPFDIFQEFFGDRDPFGSHKFNPTCEAGTEFSSMTVTFSATRPTRNVHLESSTTSVVNGHTVITTKVIQNGFETVTVEEDGVVKSTTVKQSTM